MTTSNHLFKKTVKRGKIVAKRGKMRQNLPW